MNTYAITIGREFGSHGCEIGQKLALKLNVPYYDNNSLEEIAKQYENKLTSSKDYANEFSLLQQFGLFPENDVATEAMAHAIRDIATKESCVIAGRCADYVLREYSYLMNIFIYAPLYYRIENIMHAYDLPWKSAEQMIKKVERQRHNYYKNITGQSRGDRNRKNILIDSSFLEIDDTVNLLYEMTIKKFPFAVSVE